MTWLALRAVVAKIPAIVWAIVAVCTALLVGGWILYRHGEHAGERKVVAAAHADTTRRAITAVATATGRTDSTVAVAHAARVTSDKGRAALAEVRALALPALDSAPVVVQTLVAAQDTQIHQDSVTITKQSAAIEAAANERAERVALDTARVHEREDASTDGGGISAGEVVEVGSIVIVIVEAVRFLLQLVGR